MNQYRIQQKVTMWNEYVVNTDTKGINKIIKDIVKNDWIELNEDRGLVNFENLFETEELVDVGDNGGKPTLEIYSDTKLIFDNVNGKTK